MQSKGTADVKVRISRPTALEMFSGRDPEALSGTELARALIEHVAHVGATGYSNELIIEGETWVIGIAKGRSRWPAT